MIYSFTYVTCHKAIHTLGTHFQSPCSHGNQQRYSMKEKGNILIYYYSLIYFLIILLINVNINQYIDGCIILMYYIILYNYIIKILYDILINI